MSEYDDNQGWGDDISHGYQNSSLRKDENLADRTDISEEEKSRRKKLEEIAAGVVSRGILGYAHYHFYENHEAKEGSREYNGSANKL